MIKGVDSPLLDIFRELVSQPRPEVLNFQVNDICNARCVMCNIWQNKRGRELSPDEFALLLQKPFFQGVKHVGITGGEPTLRGDLPRFYEVLPTTLPELLSGSFITNGFKSPQAIEAYAQVHHAYVAAKKHFAGMVSIDGVGSIHDRVRGREGSFLKATATLFGLRDAGVSVHAACTIVKSNVWHVDELLDWGKRNNVYIRFRMGEFIRRLYNLDLRAEIRAFDEFEVKHLVSFFHKLIHSYETEERVLLTYQSILSVLTGGERLVKCPYQTSHALNLGSDGRFATCAPCGQSATIGKNPARSTRRILERFKIRVRSCPTCIHDYHAPLTTRETSRRLEANAFASKLANFPTPPPTPVSSSSHTRGHILIVGWYGTETAGDIAILGGLLGQYKKRGTSRFTVLSLNPVYSRVTLPPLERELGVKLTILGYDDPRIQESLHGFDAVVMGGGPLMDIDPTELVRNIFRMARAQGVPCHIEGCGIGPLFKPRFQAVVAEMLTLATEIRLRDETSAEKARALTNNQVKAEVIPDPSVDYILQQGIRWQPSGSGVIRCWLRMLTHEYPQPTGMVESTDILTEFLRNVLKWHPTHRIEFLAMHWFHLGWDDREFARELKERLADDRVSVDMKPHTPHEILSLMAGAELNLCMRFHSVVFANTIGAPFVALDYTAGGKIAGYMAKAGLSGQELRYQDLPQLTLNAFQSRICGQQLIQSK